MTKFEPARCRRCGRLLRDHLSARAGVGARCAQYEAAEAADGPDAPLQGPGTPATAIAAIMACLEDMPDQVVDDIVARSGRNLTVLLADLMAFVVRETTGGPEWLRELALTWAQQEAR